MGFEPQKLFIGLIDFFSILMPGAMLAWLVKDSFAARLGLSESFPLNGSEAVAVFLFASYLLGHIVFLLSSVLDDWIYDPARAWTDWGQISRRLAKGDGLSASWKRSLATWLFGSNPDAAVMQAQRMKARALHGLEAEGSINAFQWCKARLTKDLPEGLLAVQRFEADSKFFRSFVVVLAVLAVFYAFRCTPYRGMAFALCLAGLGPALWRYIDQRFKSTQHAYWFAITLEGMKTEAPQTNPRSDGLTHAGGVVCRRNDANKTLEFLLVQASDDRSRWVLPKGHIEAGEDPRVTAIREAREETDCWGSIAGWLSDARLSSEPNAPLVRWFVMKKVEEPAKWPPENRQHQWLSLEQAEKNGLYPETLALLASAEKHPGLAADKNQNQNQKS